MSFPTCATAATRRLGRGLCRGLTAALNFWGVRWAEVSQLKKSKHQLQVCSCNDENGFHPSPRWFDWFCPYFTERDWCKNGLEQRLADQCALTEPQETKNITLCQEAEPYFQQGGCSGKKSSGLNRIWTLSQPRASRLVELEQCSRRAGFKAGSGFYNSSGLHMKKGLAWFILQLCASQYFIPGSSAQADRAQPVDAPAGLVSRQSHQSAGADIQMWAFGQLTCA